MSELCTDIRVARETFALRARFRVPPGETLAVLGPNGAGKSTLLAALSGALAADHGSITLGDEVLTDTARGVQLPTHRRGVGLLAQDALLFPFLTALDNVAFGPRAARRRDARDIARHWLSEVDAAELAERRPAALSGGQAQRVALARALAAEPELLLLDEPLAALDVDAAPAMRGLLHRVLRRQDRPAVLVTHDVLDAVVLADQVLVLGDGAVIEQGRTREVLTRPAAPFTARIAGLNLISGTAVDGGVAFAGGTVSGRPGEPVPVDARVAAVFAPSAVAVHPHRPHASPRNAVCVRVTGLDPRGDVVRLRAEVIADPRCVLAAEITLAAVADLELTVGERVWFVIKATEVAIHPVSGGSSGA